MLLEHYYRYLTHQEREGIPNYLSFFLTGAQKPLNTASSSSPYPLSPPCFLPFYRSNSDFYFLRKKISFGVARGFRLHKWKLLLYCLHSPTDSQQCLISRTGKGVGGGRRGSSRTDHLSGSNEGAKSLPRNRKHVRPSQTSISGHPDCSPHKQLLPSSTSMGSVMWLALLFRTALKLNA